MSVLTPLLKHMKCFINVSVTKLHAKFGVQEGILHI